MQNILRTSEDCHSWTLLDVYGRLEWSDCFVQMTLLALAGLALRATRRAEGLDQREFKQPAKA
jgi:hypothetical protein